MLVFCFCFFLETAAQAGRRWAKEFEKSCFYKIVKSTWECFSVSLWLLYSTSVTANTHEEGNNTRTDNTPDQILWSVKKSSSWWYDRLPCLLQPLLIYQSFKKVCVCGRQEVLSLSVRGEHTPHNRKSIFRGQCWYREYVGSCLFDI